jgi:hypothetical protein
MANQSSARLKGDDYQHLISWLYILSLKRPSHKVGLVKIEDADAGLVDDVTVYKNTTPKSVDFYQIKYHVDQRKQYSIETLLDTSAGTSLMTKFWQTWKTVAGNFGKENVRLHLYSNWLIDSNCAVLLCINNENGTLSDSFYKSSSRSDLGKKREYWREKLSATEDDFFQFTNSLVFHLGRDFSEELKQRVSDQMELVGLKSDENALLVAAGIVREWIKAKVQEITLEVLDKQIVAHDLRKPENEERACAVHLVTIKDALYDIRPDYIIDWKHYFEKVAGRGDHALLSEYDWNRTLMPELQSTENKISSETSDRLIRARGLARLSAWFAFGFTFSDVAGYKIEVDQQGLRWRTDAKPNSEFQIVSENGDGEQYSSDKKTVAVGLSVTGSLSDSVKQYLEVGNSVDALLLLRPDRNLDKSCLQSAEDAVALANKTKEKIRQFVVKNKAEKLLLFYYGPLSGACFIGHQLNAVCKEIQIMENTSNAYFPSFLLK